MATILDITILKGFSIIFVMVLIIVLVYAFLQYSQVFGASKGLHVLIAFLVGLLSLLIPDITELLATMIPWFIVFFMFVIFLLMGYKLFGATDSDISSFMKSDSTVGWGVLIVALVIIVAAAGNVYGQRHLERDSSVGVVESNYSVSAQSSSVETGKWSSNLYTTIYHPKVLGMLLLFAIGTITIGVLSSSAE